jgi:hypothetical protein
MLTYTGRPIVPLLDFGLAHDNQTETGLVSRLRQSAVHP